MLEAFKKTKEYLQFLKENPGATDEDIKNSAEFKKFLNKHEEIVNGFFKSKHYNEFLKENPYECCKQEFKNSKPYLKYL